MLIESNQILFPGPE